MASDGREVAPGRIPGGTSAEATRRWNAFFAAQSTGSPARAPLGGFRLGFDLRAREPQQSNDGRARFTFWEERGWLSCQMDKSGRTLLLGPEGPFLVDAGKATSLRGRDFKEDRKKLLEWVAIARNYLALVQPARVRLVELRERADPQLAWSTPALAARLSTQGRSRAEERFDIRKNVNILQGWFRQAIEGRAPAESRARACARA